MIRTRLETERLRLRHFDRGDLQVMFELNSDPDVIRYAEATPARDLDDARRRLEEGPLADYRLHGYGRFAVELKESGELIGFCGIKYIPEIGLPEIGYRYFKRYWGRGIGTEAARVCVVFAREDLQIEKLVALIIPENVASIRVAEKLGMKRGPFIHVFGTDVYQYEMSL